MTSILMIPQKYFPSQQAMLETVYSRLLPERGYQVSWLMLSAEVSQPARTTWNGTRAYLFPVLRRTASIETGLRAWAIEKVSWLRLLWFAVLLSRREHFDIVQVRNAVSAGVVAWLIARFTPARFVYQFSYPIPESSIQAAREGRKRLRYLRIGFGHAQIALRNWLLRRADLVLAISDEMRRQLLALGVQRERVFAFPMGTECPPEPDTAHVSQLRNRLGLDGCPVVIYLGTISRERRLDFLVRVAARVRRHHPSVRWLFVGPAHNEEDARLMREAQEAGVADAFVFTGKVPRSETPAYLSLADISVSPIPPIPLYWVSSPTKVVESLAMACPVVATEIPDQVTVISESGGGLIAPYEEEAFASAICELLSDPAKAAEMGQAGRAYVRRYRSYEYLADQIDRRYQQLLNTYQ